MEKLTGETKVAGYKFFFLVYEPCSREKGGLLHLHQEWYQSIHHKINSLTLSKTTKFWTQPN